MSLIGEVILTSSKVYTAAASGTSVFGLVLQSDEQPSSMSNGSMVSSAFISVSLRFARRVGRGNRRLDVADDREYLRGTCAGRCDTTALTYLVCEMLPNVAAAGDMPLSGPFA